MADETLIAFNSATNQYESDDGNVTIAFDAKRMGFVVKGAMGGGSAIFVPTDQVFASAGARDTFFGANPDRLVSNPWCMVGGALQMYVNGAWTAGTTAIQGTPPLRGEPYPTL